MYSLYMSQFTTMRSLQSPLNQVISGGQQSNWTHLQLYGSRLRQIYLQYFTVAL